MKLSFGIYKKQLLFFLGLFLVVGGVLYFVNRQLSFASINEVAVPEQSGAYNINIDVSENGDVLINDKSYNNILKIDKDFDELRYIAADKERQYIDELHIYVRLPKQIEKDKVKQIIYAVHGVGEYTHGWQDSQTLVYSAYNLSPSATFTIVAEFPKGTFTFPWYKQLTASVTSMPPIVWLIISVILPLISIIILFSMFRQAITDWKIKNIKQVSNKPPSDLTPSEVEVLMYGKVSARSIAATLLDLARRNYVTIVNKRGEYLFGRKRSIDLSSTSNQGLNKFETVLLSKIFTEEQVKSTMEDIQVRIGHHVFSRKVAEVYLEIYNMVTKKGYFIENPSEMHARYKRIGIIAFFVSLTGFFYGTFFAPDPKYYLIFWAAMIFNSYLIIRMSTQLPVRTPLGQAEVQKWLAFKNYLTDSTPIGYQDGVQNVFEKYLPYAIALKCETEWSKRFYEHPFTQPEWYYSDKDVVVIEDFIEDIFPVVGFVAGELSAAREPIV